MTDNDTPVLGDSVDVVDGELQATGNSVYEIRGLDPAGKGSGFTITLNADFADALRSLSVSDQQEAAAEHITDTLLDHRMGALRFEGDSFLLSNITVAPQATGLDHQGENRNGYEYNTHNVDTEAEAFEIIAAFSQWVTFGRVLLEGEFGDDDADSESA